jgi:hypothetical protein
MRLSVYDVTWLVINKVWPFDVVHNGIVLYVYLIGEHLPKAPMDKSMKWIYS